MIHTKSAEEAKALERQRKRGEPPPTTIESRPYGIRSPTLSAGSKEERVDRSSASDHQLERFGGFKDPQTSNGRDSAPSTSRKRSADDLDTPSKKLRMLVSLLGNYV
jgi:hypothetical protein